MSFLLTSLILCLFQVQEPKLQLDESLTDYRKAMHYIDVRGDYAKGVEILERIVLADDVLAVPGQASWILAQSTRAFTLAGEGERVLKHLPQIRSGARGTRFEEPVNAMLLTFAAQGAGLDPEFFANFKALWGSENGPLSLIQAYGRDLLPYLNHIIDTPSDYGLHSRLKAVSMMMPIMDARHTNVLSQLLLKQDFFASKALTQFHGSNNQVPSAFIDEEARIALGAVLLQLSTDASFHEQEELLDAMLGIMHWGIRGGNSSHESPIDSQLKARALELIESGNLGKTGNAFVTIGERYSSADGPWKEMALHFAEHRNLEFRESMRMELAKEQGASSWIREWSTSGELGDELRYCLQLYPFNLNNTQSQNKEPWTDWALQTLRQDFPQGFPDGRTLRRNREGVDKSSLSNLAQSKHPITKFIASVNLDYYWGDSEEAFLFFTNLGEDTTWASHFLSYAMNRGSSLSKASIQYLLPLVNHSELGEEVRSILNEKGGGALTIQQWIDYDLNPNQSGIGSIASRAGNEKDHDALLWIILNADQDSDAVRQAGFWLSSQKPLMFLDAIAALEKAGRRESLEDPEFQAWALVLNISDNNAISGREVHLESLIFGSDKVSDASQLFTSVARQNPHLAIAMAHRHREDLAAIKLVFGSGVHYIAASEDYANESTELILALLQHGQIGKLDNKERVLENWVSLSSELASPIFNLLWELENPSREITKYRIKLTAKSSALRSEFMPQVVHQLRNPQWTGEVCSAFMNEGATEEILDACLNRLQEEVQISNVKALLGTISKVDDPRVIEVLLHHLNDPRQGIPEAASAGLDYLRKLRTQKQEWAAWAAGNGAVSPIAALLKDLRDPEKEIRLAAIASLGTLRSTEALPALVNLLRESDEDIKQAARKALARINAEPSLPEEIVEEPNEPREPKKE